MLKREIGRPLVVVLGFLIFLSFLHWELGFSLIFLGIGLILGHFLLNLDQAIYCYFQAPHELASQRVRRLFEQRRYKEGLIFLLESQEERRRAIFHSILFQLVLLVACFFVLTSSGSLLGKGLVLGLFFRSLYEQAESFLGRGQMDSWFWQFRVVPNPRLQVFYFILMVLVFVVFSLLAI